MECTLDMNARERLELPNGMMKHYTRTHYHYHYHGMVLPEDKNIHKIITCSLQCPEPNELVKHPQFISPLYSITNQVLSQWIMQYSLTQLRAYIGI